MKGGRNRNKSKSTTTIDRDGCGASNKLIFAGEKKVAAKATTSL